MKRFSTALLAAALALVFSQGALAQAFPSKPIRIICPFPPGGGVDITARAIGLELSKSMGQPVTVENKPGAGGNIGAAETARSAPDGYTLFLTLNSLHSINPLLYAKLPFDAMKDFAFITPLVAFSNVLIVNPANPAKSVQELIAQAKAQPGKLTYASSGNGTNVHLVGELFRSMAGVDIVHVPYKGSAPALTDMLSGNVTMMFETIPFAISQIKSGKLRACGHEREAPALDARGSDARRVGAAGLRHDRVVRAHRAGRHAAGHRHEAERRSDQGRPVEGIPRAHGAAGLRDRHGNARAHGRHGESRRRALGAGGQGHRREDRVADPAASQSIRKLSGVISSAVRCR